MLRIVRFAFASHARWRASFRARASAAAASPSLDCARLLDAAGAGAFSQARVAASVLLGVVQSCATTASRGMSESSVANARAARMGSSGNTRLRPGPRALYAFSNQAPNFNPISLCLGNSWPQEPQADERKRSAKHHCKRHKTASRRVSVSRCMEVVIVLLHLPDVAFPPPFRKGRQRHCVGNYDRHDMLACAPVLGSFVRRRSLDERPNQTEQFLVFRSPPTAHEKGADINIGSLSSGGRIRLMQDRYATVGIADEKPLVSIRAAIKLSPGKTHVHRSYAWRRVQGTITSWRREDRNSE
jgi:hypothetical protein